MIDHLLWAVLDLDDGMADIERRCGVAPQVGGRHPGIGTHNALLGLGDACYLEIIALDPSQDVISGLGQGLVGLQRPKLLTWCAAAEDLAAVAARARDLGLSPSPITAMQRRRPDGELLSWRLLFLEGHDFGPTVPFFIDWRGSEHPSRSVAPGCRLDALVLGHPRPEPLQRLCEQLLPTPEPRLRYRTDVDAGLSARLTCPSGEVQLGKPFRV